LLKKLHLIQFKFNLKGISFLIWDIGGHDKLRPLWRVSIDIYSIYGIYSMYSMYTKPEILCIVEGIKLCHFWVIYATFMWLIFQQLLHFMWLTSKLCYHNLDKNNFISNGLALNYD
jgi:hypothetical protein